MDLLPDIVDGKLVEQPEAWTRPEVTRRYRVEHVGINKAFNKSGKRKAKNKK